jgi:protein involved in polysaccharide export with SLBB domain
MRMRTLVCLILEATAVALLSACAATGDAPIEAANSTGAELVKPAETREPQHYRFYPGDELSVMAVNRPELTVAHIRVDPYGYITYPYLGQVYVKNLSPQEVGERLTRGLQEKDYYKQVALGVSFVASKEQFVYILGEVKTPGPIPIAGEISLLDAIGRAGGKTYDAEMSTVMFIRGSQSPPGVVKLNLAALGDPSSKDPNIPNFTLIPGDVIYVPDSVITSVQRFFNRMYDIIRPVVALETGIVLYDSVERVLSGRYPDPTGRNNSTTIIVPNLGK